MTAGRGSSQMANNREVAEVRLNCSFVHPTFTPFLSLEARCLSHMRSVLRDAQGEHMHLEHLDDHPVTCSPIHCSNICMNCSRTSATRGGWRTPRGEASASLHLPLKPLPHHKAPNLLVSLADHWILFLWHYGSVYVLCVSVAVHGDHSHPHLL